MEVSTAEKYLIGLEPHLKAAIRDLPVDAGDYFRKKMSFLVIEDLGTRGLTGDIRANSEREGDNNFWGFFRSIGISPKRENAAGSWGLGKWVFPDASNINVFLGVTQRVNEKNRLLMGGAVLRTHSLNGKKYRPNGWFASHSEEQDDSWLPMPEDAQNLIRDACIDFHLERLEGDDVSPGLSVIVLFPNKDLKQDAIIRATVVQYFVPIVNGELVVQVSQPGSSPTLINADTIWDVASSIPPSERDDESAESMQRAIRLAQWAQTVTDDQCISMDVPTKRAALDPTVMERYDTGDRLAFRLTTTTTRRNSERLQNTFKVFLEKDDWLEKGHDYFVRGMLRIPVMDYIVPFKARALVVIDGNSELGILLRDSEGPAHMRWDRRSDSLKARWSGGQTIVTNVQRAAYLILQALAERPQTLDRHALADLFPSQRASERSHRRPGQDPGVGGSAQTLPTLSTSNLLDVRRLPDGFQLSRGSANSSARGKWRLNIAYDVSRGNAFAAFRTGAREGIPDFSLFPTGALRINAIGCSCDVKDDNILEFDVLHEEFKLAINGFDGRDVVVGIQQLKDGVEGAEAE